MAGASSSGFKAKDFSWMTELPQLWDATWHFRNRSLMGQNLTRGLFLPGRSGEVVVGSLECCGLNHDLLRPVVKLMGDRGCIFTPPVHLLQAAALEFHSACGFPDADALRLVGYDDGWGLKKMLTFLRRKWSKDENPREALLNSSVSSLCNVQVPACLAQDKSVRPLVEELQRAYATLQKEPGHTQDVLNQHEEQF